METPVQQVVRVGANGGPALRPFRILVVDDSAIMRTLVSDFARDGGHEAQTVSGGAEAIELLRSSSFDLVFLDIYMPGMSGLETLQKLRDEGCGVRVVIMTSDRNEETFDSAHAKALKVSGFINKPFSYDIFTSCLKTVLELRGVFSHKKEGLY